MNRASDVTSTDRWLNFWCIWHAKMETLQKFQRRHQIGLIIQDFQEKCVLPSLTFCLETKMRFNDSEQTLSFERQYVYTRCTFRFKTLQDVFVHLDLCYTQHERWLSKIQSFWAVWLSIANKALFWHRINANLFFVRVSLRLNRLTQKCIRFVTQNPSNPVAYLHLTCYLKEKYTITDVFDHSSAEVQPMLLSKNWLFYSG